MFRESVAAAAALVIFFELICDGMGKVVDVGAVAGVSTSWVRWASCVLCGPGDRSCRSDGCRVGFDCARSLGLRAWTIWPPR